MGRLWVSVLAHKSPTTALLAVGGVVTPIAVIIGTLGRQCGQNAPCASALEQFIANVWVLCLQRSAVTNSPCQWG
ncbi:hypothetical protein [Ruminiclostridium cellobioparum]|uniref:hypothetical protein n=1 Tax=Ruminiclostridium cellobioparum TaxID=29355 RepID=UPI0028A631F9|nr:hypothetical protein [Ruminiclostridium cellobioparum]